MTTKISVTKTIILVLCLVIIYLLYLNYQDGLFIQYLLDEDSKHRDMLVNCAKKLYGSQEIWNESSITWNTKVILGSLTNYGLK